MEELNAYRKHMIEDGGNLGWCEPVVFDTEKGKIIIVDNEFDLVGCQINGEIVPGMTWEKLANLVNPEYDEYEGWKDRDIAYDVDSRTIGCASCPWFMECDAMDDE